VSTLFVVATPIGNLEDITLRALRVLREVPLVIAEDTRSARVLLDHHGIRAALLSYNEHNRGRRLPEIIGRLAGGDAALVADAGTPAISDPGRELVEAARAAGHTVSPVPGASAVTAAVSASGLAAQTYRFAGFLPRQAGALRRFVNGLRDQAETVVAFESPSRLTRTLAVLAEALPERRVAVCRELTKLHEEVFVGTAVAAAERFQAPRGEVVLLIEGTRRPAAAPAAAGEDARAELRRMKAAGLTRAQAAALLGERSRLPRRRLYRLWLEV
jgi:16S rRNA (cytidine1402-2'-O)-methyltransferase